MKHLTLPIAIGTSGPWFEPRWAHKTVSIK